MTDLEMDFYITHVEARILKQTVRDQEDTIANLKNHVAALQTIIENQRKHKCNFGGVCIKPDGVNELDPCIYETIEKHRNVTVEVIRCKNCGHIEVLWERQENTEDGDESGRNQMDQNHN